jgi:hypothetical protein
MIWRSGGLGRDFEDFNFPHSEFLRTRENRVHSGVVSVIDTTGSVTHSA